MKRRAGSLVLFVFMLFVSLSLVSCATGPPTVQKYQALDKAADLRLAVLQGAGDYYSMGMIDEATKEKIIEVDKHVQEAGKTATAALNEIVLLEALQDMDPEQVTPEEYAAAVKAYNDAKVNMRAQWREMILLVDPYLMDWIKKAAAK